MFTILNYKDYGYIKFNTLHIWFVGLFLVLGIFVFLPEATSNTKRPTNRKVTRGCLAAVMVHSASVNTPCKSQNIVEYQPVQFLRHAEATSQLLDTDFHAEERDTSEVVRRHRRARRGRVDQDHLCFALA